MRMQTNSFVGRYLGVGSATKRRQKKISPAPSVTTLQPLKTKWVDNSVFIQGTITPISNFNAELAARQLNNALAGPEIDSAIIISVITSHSNQQRQSIKRHYQYMFGKHLEADIGDTLGGLFRDVYLALLQDSLDYLVSNLHNALVCIQPEENELIELLCNRSNEKLRQIKETYQKKYGRSIDLVVKRELTGDLQRVMRALLNNGREEQEEENIEQAHLDAQMMVTSGVGTKYGTDDAVVAALLNTRSYEHLRETFDEYKRLRGQDVEDSIQDQFSGTLRHGLLELVKVVKDPVNFFADHLHNMTDENNFDNQKLVRFLVLRSEVDLLDIKERYLTLYGAKVSDAISDRTSGDYKSIILKILGY